MTTVINETADAVNCIDVIQFLKDLQPEGPWCLSAINNAKKEPPHTRTFGPGDEGNLSDFLKNYNNALKWSLHFHVGRVGSKLSRKPSREDFKWVDYFHVDIDPDKTKDRDAERERILAMFSDNGLMDRDMPKPTFLIDSGNGYQAFWKLDIPWPMNGTVEMADEVARYNKQIARLFNADDCHDISHLMRLPHTTSWKTKEGRPTKLIINRPGKSYPLENFTKAAGSATSKSADVIQFQAEQISDLWETLHPYGVPDWCLIAISCGEEPDYSWRHNGDRSKWCWAVVCELADRKVPGDLVKGILLDPTWGIIAHVLDQGDPADYADRQISRSRSPDVNTRLQAELPPPAKFVRLAPIPDDLPGRPWIVKGLLLRREIAILSGPGGAGKSAFALGLADALGKGKAFGHLPQPTQACRVLFITSEDGLEENQMRLKAREIKSGEPSSENVWVLGDNRDIAMLMLPRGADRDAEPVKSELARDLVKFIRENQIDVVILDPFVETYRGLNESDNNQMRDVMVFLRDMIKDENVALLILHHDRKGGGGEGSTADGARGASAITNAARFHYAFLKMTEAEAKALKVDDWGPFVRFVFGKSNRVARTDDIWYGFESIELSNGESIGHLDLASLSKGDVNFDGIRSLIETGRDGDGLLPYLVSNRNNNERLDEAMVNRKFAPNLVIAKKALDQMAREGSIEPYEWKNTETRKAVAAWRLGAV